MTETTDAVGTLLLEESKHHLGESLARILKCLDHLTEDEIWRWPNKETTSIGNLVLHLCGNVRQWIVSGLGSAPDLRKRSAEFSEKGPLPTEDLIGRLEGTVREALEVIDVLEATALTKSRSVQGNEVTGVNILVHVVEHFSYHTGEITYAVKTLKAVDLQYYEGEDLDVTG